MENAEMAESKKIKVIEKQEVNYKQYVAAAAAWEDAAAHAKVQHMQLQYTYS